MGKIFYILGKSASGKDKIYKALMSNPDLDLKKIVLYTTRPVRFGEKEGVQYFFTDVSGFKKLLDENKIIEYRSYQTIHGEWIYFTADDGQIVLDQGNYLGIGTLESFEKMKIYYGDENIIPLYIQVESGERLTRALKREKKQDQPKYEEMCRRFLADEKDFSEEKIINSGIRRRFENNNELSSCIEEITDFIKSYSIHQ